MKKITFLLTFALLNLNSFSQEKFELNTDSNGRMFFNNIPQSTKNQRVTNSLQQVQLTVTLDSNFGESQANAHFSFPTDIDLSKVKNFTLITKTSPLSSPVSSRADKVTYFSGKAINKISRTLDAKIGGLKPNTDYYLNVIIQYDHPSYSCSGEITHQEYFKTKIEPIGRQKKLLIVIDADLQNDADVNNALNIYMNDVSKYYNISFEKLYINNNFSEKQALYNKVKTDYTNISNPLRYLFFIGSNASMTIIRQYLNYADNSPLYTYYDSSINFYTQINLPAFYFDATDNNLRQKTYQYCANVGFPPNDIGNSIAQSNSFDIAFGSILPNGSIGKKQSILNYFTKLHLFKTGNLTFNKSVLFADTFRNDGTFPSSLASMNSRWQLNDTINVSQKYGDFYYGSYPTWTNDYTQKISTKSYEICAYMGHGSPSEHYFGIYPYTINSLSNLNTMVFDFISCSVGNFSQYNYLAGAYFEKGNTLFVKAYSQNIGTAVFNNQSPLLDFFKNGEVFSDIGKREFLGDSYLHNTSMVSVQVHLGDPLLQLDPPCTQNTATLISPTNNINGIAVQAFSNWIKATNTISELSEAKYKAGDYIQFNPGFDIKKGAVFKTDINGCQ
jgi:hypothetical protein